MSTFAKINTKYKMLQRAIEIATKAHQGQTDKAGKPYIDHPLRVMRMGTTTEEMIVGVLHDVIEDTDWTFDKLLAEGFSFEVVDALQCVTKLSEDEPYDQFIARIKVNPLAVKVKLNDLTDNMDIRRLVCITDKDVERLKKYLRAYKQLTGELAYSVEACRLEHPKAYMPWTKEEDEQLEILFCEGKSIKDLSKIFQRNKGGIVSRIKKLELKEKY